MITIRRRAGRVLLVAAATLMMLVGGAPAWARPAPPERLVGGAPAGGAVAVPTEPVTTGTPVWQFLLVAALAAAVAVAVVAVADRAVLHRHQVAH